MTHLCTEMAWTGGVAVWVAVGTVPGASGIPAAPGARRTLGGS